MARRGSWRIGACVMLATALGFVLSACQSNPPNYYMLNGMEPTTTAQAARTNKELRSIAIRPVTVADYLDRSEIVKTSGSVRISINDQERWGEKLSLMIARALAENLRAHLPSTTVTILPTDFAIPPQRELVVSIERFEADGQGDVSLNGRWQLIDSRRTIATTGAAIAINEPAGSDASYEAVAQAMSRALDRLAAEIAKRAR